MAKLAVVGSGLMGSGITQVAAVAGWDVVMHDQTTEATERGMSAIKSSLDRFVKKEKISEADVDAALGRMSTSTDLDVVSDADFVVEAVFEDIDVKHDIFKKLDALCKDDAVLGTNTSALPITKVAAVTDRPESVVGVHFFSPVPMMKLVELVRGLKTSDETLAKARSFAEGLGKTCIVVNRDIAGFVTTRLISALVVEAATLVENGVATAEDIDTACKLGFGHAMGPLMTTDLTGVDVLRNASENIYHETRDEKFAVPELMTRMVTAGDLGRKSGKGFYSY